MALSNIRREPRREITESIVGLIAVALFGVLDAIFARFFHDHALKPDAGDYVAGSVVGILLALVVFLLVMGIVYGSHALGETICDWLAAMKMDPRPKQRY